MGVPDMRRKVGNNGFKLDYDGPIFPASQSNEISYDTFCFMGGLENGRLHKIEQINGSYRYYRCDIR